MSAETKLAMLRRKMEGGGRAALEDLRRQEQDLMSVARIEAREAGRVPPRAAPRMPQWRRLARGPPHTRPAPTPFPPSIAAALGSQKTAKKCPRCGMATEKAEGCNKMSCGGCGAFWCWRCGKAIDGYRHFRSGDCVLFDEAEILRCMGGMGV